MKIQIRQGVFETNSSSTHALALYDKADWEKFKAGEYVLEGFPYLGALVDKNSVEESNIFDIDTDKRRWECEYMTYNAFEKETDYEVLIESNETSVAVSVEGYD